MTEADDGLQAGAPVDETALAAPEPTDIDRARSLLEGVDPAAYHRSIAGLARSTHGLLQPLEFSRSHEFHDPTCVVVEPHQTGIETVSLYSNAAYPEFEQRMAKPFNDPSLDHLITNIYHGLMNEGINIAVVTNHGQIIDIALVLASLVLALCNEDRTFGVLGERTTLDEIALRSNLVLSRMVTTTQVFTIPTTKVLSNMCRTFYSVPQTASRRRVKIDTDLARANNLLMRDRLERQLADGGQLLVMAASGSQDLSLAPRLVQKVRSTWRSRRGDDPGDAPSMHLQPLYNGTMNLMLDCHYVLPIAISLDETHPAFVVGGLTRVRTSEDCHDVMDWIAASHEAATGVATIYHHREDDLLGQVRDVLRS